MPFTNSPDKRPRKPGNVPTGMEPKMENEARYASPSYDAPAVHVADFHSDPDQGDPSRHPRRPVSIRDLLQRVHREVEFAQAVLVSLVPRGGVQVIGPDHADEALVRGLSRHADGEDRVTWSALLTGNPARSEELWSLQELADSEFSQHVLRPGGLGSHIAVPVTDPLLPGFGGVLVLFREASAPAFTASDVGKLVGLIPELEKQLRRKPAAPAPLAHDIAAPLIAFGPGGQVLFPANGSDALAGVSDRLRSQIEQAVRKSLDKRGSDAGGKRVVLPDDRGDLWVFRLRRVESYPALTGPAGLPQDTPVVFLTHQPAPADYAAVSAEDVAADEEMARLVPAMRFMYDEHRNGPTLEVIAKSVHLSPFHFHRRFTELLGLTPKHYLFDCQIDTAKRQLVAGMDLAEIAKHCGFAHQSHFTSRFKQATGLTPTRWRKLAKG